MFNPNEHLIQLKGKDYLQVQWRLVWFRDPDDGRQGWGIRTTLVDHGDDWAIFKAEIIDEHGDVRSSGHGSESKRDFNDYLEKAETKAVGRALAMMGFGTQFVADELDEGERIVDSPVDRKAKVEPAARDPEAIYKDDIICEDCGRPIRDSKKKNGNVWPAAQIAKTTKTRFGRVLCAECGAVEAAKNEG